MTFVRSIPGNRPAKRFDNVPWTHVRIEEAAVASGPRVPLETQTLANPDPDPSLPAVRNITTTLATLEAGFYWLVWIDDAGNEDPSGPTFAGAVAGIPTAGDVRRMAPPLFPWADAGYAPPAPGDPDPLDTRVAWAAGEVASITGRDPSTLTAQETLIVQRAITLKVITDALGGTTKALKVLGAPWLRSMSAGSYSETRFSPAEMSGIQGRGREGLASLGPEPLPTLLWMLMTPEKQAEWRYLLTGVAAPAGTFVRPDFSSGERIGPLAWGPGITHPWPFGDW